MRCNLRCHAQSKEGGQKKRCQGTRGKWEAASRTGQLRQVRGLGRSKLIGSDNSEVWEAGASRSEAHPSSQIISIRTVSRVIEGFDSIPPDVLARAKAASQLLDRYYRALLSGLPRLLPTRLLIQLQLRWHTLFNAGPDISQSHRDAAHKSPSPQGYLRQQFLTVQRLQCRFADNDAQPSVRLRQTVEIRHRTRTIEIPIPRLLRQDPCIHTRLPAPLHRAFRDPSPVEPAPAELETRHLRLGVRQQPLLVNVAVGARVGVCAVAGAGAGVGRA